MGDWQREVARGTAQLLKTLLGDSSSLPWVQWDRCTHADVTLLRVAIADIHASSNVADALRVLCRLGIEPIEDRGTYYVCDHVDAYWIQLDGTGAPEVLVVLRKSAAGMEPFELKVYREDDAGLCLLDDIAVLENRALLAVRAVRLTGIGLEIAVVASYDYQGTVSHPYKLAIYKLVGGRLECVFLRTLMFEQVETGIDVLSVIRIPARGKIELIERFNYWRSADEASDTVLWYLKERMVSTFVFEWDGLRFSVVDADFH